MLYTRSLITVTSAPVSTIVFVNILCTDISAFIVTALTLSTITCKVCSSEMQVFDKCPNSFFKVVSSFNSFDCVVHGVLAVSMVFFNNGSESWPADSAPWRFPMTLASPCHADVAACLQNLLP